MGNINFRMFLLELIGAFVYAGQLRLLEKYPQGPLTRYYVFNLIAMGIIFIWSYVGSAELPNLHILRRYLGIRILNVVLTGIGIAFETIPKLRDCLEASRWLIAVSFAVVSTYYLASRPWELKKNHT
jgi:hypothetical protein